MENSIVAILNELESQNLMLSRIMF